MEIQKLLLAGITLLTAFYLSDSRLVAQSSESVNRPASATIVGFVADKETGKALGQTNAVLRSSNDSTVVTGTSVLADGNFRIKDIPIGEYFMEISHHKYRKLIIGDIIVNKPNKLIDFGQFYLDILPLSLETVVVY